MEFGTSEFWLALGTIIWVNILLSGDNAIVIALAARGLPPDQQRKAIAIGSSAAIVMRILLTLVAAKLLLIPYLKLVGAALLVYIGIDLLKDEGGEDEDGHKAHGTLGAAIKTILIADLIMSVDNVIGVAAAAKDSTLLLVLGLAISIPLVIFGSTLLLKVIEKFPAIVWFGAAMLGFIAGEIAVQDPAIRQSVEAWAAGFGLDPKNLARVAGAIGAALVLFLGKVVFAGKKSAQT